jgi:hypothetical protein
MATILYILLATIFVIAVEFAYFLFRKTAVYSLLRDSLWRFSSSVSPSVSRLSIALGPMVGLDWRLLIATSAKFLFLVSSRAEESGGFASAPVSSALQIGLRQALNMA